MALKKDSHLLLWTVICTLVGFAALALGAVFNPVNHYLTGLYLVIVAAALYFIIVFLVADRNWLDIRAVFAAIWIATIGLASLRLTNYQKPWEAKTWLLLAAAYAMFQIGGTLGVRAGKASYGKLQAKCKKLRLGKFRLEAQENRLFAICVVTTLIGFGCFAINVAIRGYIPCFSDSVTAYLDFYTKFHVFAVAATAISGLCYYCLCTQKLNIFKKIILVLCIFYLVILFPILVVSRGTFIMAAVSLTVSVFYMHKKKLIALILCVVAILGVYMMTSSLRGYTDAQLKEIFQPSEIVIEEETEPTDPTEETKEEDEIEDEKTEPTTTVFSLSPKMVFLYSYLTVGYDNFNEAVVNLEDYTYGTRLMSPFNVILRINWIDERNETAPYYKVQPHLNTICVIGDFYYDFGTIGVILLMLLWSVIFGVMQGFCDVGRGPFALLAFGNGMVPVAMCFFDPWLRNFTLWMLWGVGLLAAIAGCIKKEKK